MISAFSAVRRCRSGFTLIELLVVITIIAILAALGLGAFGKASQKARDTACISNLRQIRIGIMNYVTDKDGYLPRPTIKPAESGLSSDYMWSKQLGPYLPQRGTTQTAQQNLVFVCPAASYKGYSKSTTSSTYNCSAALYFFPENASPTNTGSASSGPARLFVNLDNLNQTILVSEGKQNGTEASCTSSLNWTAVNTDLGKSSPAATENLDFRHSDSINILYADGHVSAVPFSERQTSITRPRWESRNWP